MSTPWPILVIGFLPLAGWLLHVIKKAFCIGNWIRIKGEVVDLQEVGNEKHLAPIVTFPSPHGGVHRLEKTAGQDPPRYAVGDTVEIIYPPGKPEDALIASFVGIWAVEMFALVLVGAFPVALFALTHVLPAIPGFIREEFMGHG